MSDETRRTLERRVETGDRQALKLLEATLRREGIESFTGKCQNCRETKTVTIEPSRTACANEAENVPSVLCEPCAIEYHEYWDDRWDEYYRGLM